MSNKNATEITRGIMIFVDQVWAGSGKLRGTVNVDDGVEIVDCGAQFCDDTDESLSVYELIEDAIDSGESSIKVELDGETKTISWTISGSA